MKINRSVLCVAAILIVSRGRGQLGARASHQRRPRTTIPISTTTATAPASTASVDQVLAAMVAHDASSLPLARDVKYTENGQLLKIGDGFWGTASGSPTYKIYADDPQAGQAMFLGVLPENGAPVILCVRLKVELHRITRNRSDRRPQGSRAASRARKTSSRRIRSSLRPFRRRSGARGRT